MKAAGTWAFFAFLAIAAYSLFAENRAHMVEYLPFVLVLACLLMHLFHRHGDRHTKGQDHEH